VTDATAPETKKLGLKLVLTGLVLATVLLTALFIHLLWANAARRNVADVVAQLNREIIDRVKNEVRGVLDDAVAAQNAVGSVFANGTITLNEESKRDFIFLALLRSKPSLSWISLGTGDGSFFGAQRELVAQSDGDHLKIVTVALDPTSSARSEHSFSFEAKGNDIQYVSKEDPRPSGYDATQQAWYRRALAEGPGWNDDPDVPEVARAGISTSTPLDINSKRVGVINVVIELERLSSFLQRLQVGKSGTVVIIDRDGHVVASADETAIAQQRLGQMPMLGELGATNPLLALADDMIDSKKVNLRSVGDPRQFEITSPKDGRSYYVTFAALKFGGWIAATVVPASDFLTSIEDNARSLLAALAVLTLAMAGLSAMLTNRLVVRPLTRIVGQLAYRGLPARSGSASPHGCASSTASDGAPAESRGLASFQKYMPIELVRQLISRGIEAEPGGEQLSLTVMFTDLAGFTSLSEMLGEDVVPVLSEYLETASSAVDAHRGTIDKFIGDAVMAFWGAPIENSQHARDACAAALAIRRMMMARQAQMPAGDPRADLRVRIGVNTGRMLVGNIGSASRLNYTVIGDAVNVASRLEAINKRYGTAIIIGEETRHAAGDAVVVRQLDWVAVYGRNEGVAIYELLGMADDSLGDWHAWALHFETGLAAYGDRRWDEAERHFAAAAAERAGGDVPSQLFIERCRALVADPPGADWTPVAIQMEK
jgi:adenylate cyclase